MLDPFVDLMEQIGLDGAWTRWIVGAVGVICTIGTSIGGVVGSMIGAYKFMRVMVRKLRGQNSEVLQAALDALDYPEATWDGKKLNCATVEVDYYNGLTGKEGVMMSATTDIPNGGKRYFKSVTIKDAKGAPYQTDAELSTKELCVFDRKARLVIARIVADKLADSRSRTAAALRGDTEAACTGKTSRSGSPMQKIHFDKAV